jgi:hypothetical protein
MTEIKTPDHVRASSDVAVTRYERDVRSEALTSGFAIVETRLEEAFTGDLVGTGYATHLRIERPDGSGRLICYERISGVLHGRRGSFLLEASGEMNADRYVHGRWEIIPTSGTDELSDIRGYAAFVAKQDSNSATGWKASTNLTYWFERGDAD